MIPTLYKAFRKVRGYCVDWVYTPVTRLYLFLNGAKCASGLKVRGLMKINVTRRGQLTIGRNFSVNSGNRFNMIGRQQRTTLWVEGKLSIGDNVGMSATAIICNHQVKIGNNVTIGGNVVIYDTDFHALNPQLRSNPSMDRKNAIRKQVIIEDFVFIGAHSTILKGVTIGKNSIIGAGSVVSGNIPPDEIWAGNPARFIKQLSA